MTGNRPIVNPYTKRRPLGRLSNGHKKINMGRQSQQRVSNTKRAFTLASTNSYKKRKSGGQLTLAGEAAFDPLVDCKICVAHAIKRVRPETVIPKRAHHPNCGKNTKTRGRGSKKKAQYLNDPLPVEDMYDSIPPNPNSRHGLVEYLSKRGESKLESFHDRASHFANSGMRNTLADNLNLMGTAQHNVRIRHKRRLINGPIDRRRRMPAAWENVVPFYNHSELSYVNQMAKRLSLRKLPFPEAETLQPDNGERFFSEYLTDVLPLVRGKYSVNGMCLCQGCNELDSAQIMVSSLAKAAVKKPPTASVPAILTPFVPAPSPATVNKKQVPRQQKDTTPTAVNCLRLYPQFSPFFLPQCYFYFPPATPAYCCDKYRLWRCSAKVGRPPHDRHCCRQQQQQEQQHIKGKGKDC